MAADGVKRWLPVLGGAAALLAIVFGGFYALTRYIAATTGPSVETLANASLQGLRTQNRLSVFAARFVAVVTSTQTRLGLSAQKTLILPGTVEYQLDMAKLSPREVTWDEPHKTLTVALPPLALSGPQIDLTQIREYGDHGLLATFTNAPKVLDAANRAAGQAALIKQANGPLPMRLARDAARRAVASNFALPLKAAGIDAHVVIRFADEGVKSGERWDTTRSLDEVLGKGG